MDFGDFYEIMIYFILQWQDFKSFYSQNPYFAAASTGFRWFLELCLKYIVYEKYMVIVKATFW